MPMEVSPNPDFIKFLSVQGEKKSLQNLDLILELEKNYPGMFIKVMSNFSEASKYRESLNENGMPVKVPWQEALKRFYEDIKYIGVTEDNTDLAKTFEERGLVQEVFDSANKLRITAKRDNIPEHILGTHLKEETILESIEKIVKQIEIEITNGRELIEDLYHKQFTYEWLSKNDPNNSIIGLLCSSCCIITSDYYGKDIAKSTIIAPDVQNLVIRDSKGEIVAKGTVYLNKRYRYAVINDFELNKQYREHELVAGIYETKPNSQDEINRDMIFRAFQRGIKAFIEEFDRQNPETPLMQVNVGMGYNKLRKQVAMFKKATSNLSVPAEYGFHDATKNEQYILYYRYKDFENEGYEK